MDPKPQTLPERIVYRTITWTWPFYAIGALYVVGPVLGFVLGGMALAALYLGPAMRRDLQPTGSIPFVIWLWILGMGVMLVSLWVGMLNWDYGLGSVIKSSIGWAKGWALMALFPLAGAVLKIRTAPIVRAQCVLGLSILILTPILVAAPYVGLPSKLFTSPFQAVGGPGPAYFSVYFYTIDPSNWQPRWQFYAPWSPFAGLLGVVMVLFALEEKHRGWMLAGILGGVAMILLSKSRMSLVALVLTTVPPRMLPLMLKAWAWVAAGMATASLAALFSPLQALLLQAIDDFKNARADSTRVRSTLQRIARERWQAEAPWFGHGRVEPGPHLVEFMPIGSHHTWFGLLFVKGLVGFFALAIPMIVHFCMILRDTVFHSRGRLPCGIMLTLFILSFGENIEIEAYLLWPALVVLGIHARQMIDEPIITHKDATALPAAA